jgi:hypothetical protein
VANEQCRRRANKNKNARKLRRSRLARARRFPGQNLAGSLIYWEPKHSQSMLTQVQTPLEARSRLVGEGHSDVGRSIEDLAPTMRELLPAADADKVLECNARRVVGRYWPKPSPSAPPQLLRGAPCALGQRSELGPHQVGVDLGPEDALGQAAIGAGDDVLAPD